MRTEVEKAIYTLICNGYGVFRVPTEVLPKVVAPPDAEEVEELAMGKQTYSVNEFCMLYGISRTFFYDLLKNGRGPDIMKVGRKTLVAKHAAEAWALRMEAGE